jgi:hypothetical protein
MQGGSLALPGLELVYLWHGFSVIGQMYHLVERFFILIEETQTQVRRTGTKQCIVNNFM